MKNRQAQNKSLTVFIFGYGDYEKGGAFPAHESNAIKLSGRTFLAPHRGSSPKGRGGYVAVLHESVEILKW